MNMHDDVAARLNIIYGSYLAAKYHGTWYQKFKVPVALYGIL